MWIGAIKLEILTAWDKWSGTDSLVEFSIVRDGHSLAVFPLDYPPLIGLKRGEMGTYVWSGKKAVPRHNDETPSLPPGELQVPMPYPDYGFEFSHDLPLHLSFKFTIRGDNEWDFGNARIYVKFIRLHNGPFGFKIWKRDSLWTNELFGSGWLIPMSTDPSEGQKTFEFKIDPLPPTPPPGE